MPDGGIPIYIAAGGPQGHLQPPHFGSALQTIERRPAQRPVGAAGPLIPDLELALEAAGGGDHRQLIGNHASGALELDHGAAVPGPAVADLQAEAHLLALGENATGLESEGGLEEELLFPLEGDHQVGGIEERQARAEALARRILQPEHGALADQELLAVPPHRSDLEAAHEPRPLALEDQIPTPGCALRQRQVIGLPPNIRRRLPLLGLAGRREEPRPEDEPLLQGRVRRRAAVDEIGDLPPLPIDHTQIGEVRLTRRQDLGRQEEARQPGLVDEDLRSLRKQAPDVGPR